MSETTISVFDPADGGRRSLRSDHTHTQNYKASTPTELIFIILLNAFAKLGKATANFIVSFVCLSLYLSVLNGNSASTRRLFVKLYIGKCDQNTPKNSSLNKIGQYLVTFEKDSVNYYNISLNTTRVERSVRQNLYGNSGHVSHTKHTAFLPQTVP